MIDYQPHPSMRGYFAHAIYGLMAKNEKIWVITGDLGYGMWDRVREFYPERFINVGASEQAMTGIAVGLAQEGMVPIVYSITTFLLYRPFETIRNYINHEQVPVKLIGSGRDKDYKHDGFSHWAEEDKQIMKVFSNIIAKWPKTKEEIPALAEEMVNDPKPWYVNLTR